MLDINGLSWSLNVNYFNRVLISRAFRSISTFYFNVFFARGVIKTTTDTKNVFENEKVEKRKECDREKEVL